MKKEKLSKEEKKKLKLEKKLNKNKPQEKVIEVKQNNNLKIIL